MVSIRRYGPSQVRPDITPTPQIGRGNEATFAVFQGALDTANQFLRPTVIKTKQAEGERKFLEVAEKTAPSWKLVKTRDANSTAIDVVPSQRNAAMNVHGGPTKAAAKEWLRYENQGAIRDKPISKELEGALSFLGAMGVEMRVVSGGQDAKGLGGKRTGSTRHDHGNAADADFYIGGRKLLASNPEDQAILSQIVSQARANGVTGVGEGDDYMGDGRLHIGFGPEATWGAGGKGENTPAWLSRAWGGAAQGSVAPGTQVNVQQQAEYELAQINKSSFEPRLPFTVQDEAFNASADRIIQSRAMIALDEGIAAAQLKADGNIDILQKEIEKVRTTVMGNLPEEMPGLKTALTESLDRAVSVAQRNAMELGARRIVAQQKEAANTAVMAIQGEADRLALTGATSAELAAHLTASQSALVQFGPREEFTLNGQTYAADPRRAGTMTPSAIASELGSVATGARKVMIEAEFQRSAAPGQFVEEFRRQVFAGNSPLPAGESLSLLSQFESRARATESARRTAANAARTLVEKKTDDRINAFVEMTEAGVPVAIPNAERAAIMDALAPYPELQREAMEKFAVADAAVATHGLSGPELTAYAGRVRADIAASVGRGELDMEGVAVLQSLEDRLKKVKDAVTAEMVGLPMIEQLAMDSATADQVDYDAIRERAAGNEDVINQINEVEGFHRDIENIRFLSADEREAALEFARDRLQKLAAQGDTYGAAALMTQNILDSLEEWSAKRKDLAATDTIKFAEASGIPMQSLEAAESLRDVGAIIASRIGAIKPKAMGEGVENPVPLTGPEAEALTTMFRDSPRGAQLEFLGQIAAQGEGQSQAVFERLGQNDPNIFAAGTVFASGNQGAAAMILRGAGETKLEGGSTLEVATARMGELGAHYAADILSGEGSDELDAAAKAYATGVALSKGEAEILPDDLAEGYLIALGKQADGTGGPVFTDYGPTIAPKGFTGDDISDAISSIDDAKLTEIAQGLVVDVAGRPVNARQLLRTVTGLRPVPGQPMQFVPVDQDGGFFLTDSGSGARAILTFDLEQMQ